MPWYAWLILVVAIGSIVGGLMMLRDSANKVELTDEQRKEYYDRFRREVRDPDTYAVLNYFFLAGLHHMYLGN